MHRCFTPALPVVLLSVLLFPARGQSTSPGASIHANLEGRVLSEITHVATTPPMGWNSWNCFRENVSEEKIKAIADAMVASGMKEAGYEYMIIDDGWMTDRRDSLGHIIVNSAKFPSGMKALGEYIHSLGLKFGIYSAPGRYTCQKLAGSGQHHAGEIVGRD